MPPSRMALVILRGPPSWHLVQHLFVQSFLHWVLWCGTQVVAAASLLPIVPFSDLAACIDMPLAHCPIADRAAVVNEHFDHARSVTQCIEY